MKKAHRRGIALPGRAIVAGLLILFQIVVFAVVGMSISKWVKIIDLVIRLLAFVLVFAIINKRSNPSYKMAWIIFILGAPFVGGVLFFLWGNGKVKPLLKKHMAVKHRQSRVFLKQNHTVMQALEDYDIHKYRQAHFTGRESGFPVYTDTSVEYFSPGAKYSTDVSV